MISWKEQEPDFKLQPAEALFARLDFGDAVRAWRCLGHGLQILISRQVREAVEAHLRTRRIEQGGLLIGAAYGASDGEPIAVTIDDFVEAEEAIGTGASLVMGSRVWEDARRRCEGQRTVVGWYHSHPNLGAFFSGTDRQTQRAFFANAHSVGLVSDPVRIEERWFSGPESAEVYPEHRRVIIFAG